MIRRLNEVFAAEITFVIAIRYWGDFQINWRNPLAIFNLQYFVKMPKHLMAIHEIVISHES